MKRDVVWTTKFKKDYKLAIKRHMNIDLLDDIHRMVKHQYWVEAEEWVCNFIADYGLKIFSVAYSILGDEAWIFVPYELEKLIA